MIKRCAGLVRSVFVVLLLGMWGTAVWAQGEVPETEAQPVPGFRAKVEARIAELKGAPTEEIEQAVLQSETRMQELSKESTAARQAARELHEKLRLENPEVRAMYQEIEKMRAQIDVFIEELPEMQAPLAAMKETQARLMEEVWFRTEAMNLVARQDRAAGFPDRPEPVLEESKPAAPAAPEQQKDLEP